MPEDRILEIRQLSKQFPGVKALVGVDFTLRKGEIHALMGENGAGKSTLIKVLTGVYPRDGGEILFEGRPFSAGSPHDAQAQGISTVYQEVNLVPNLSVAENLLLGRQPTRGGLIVGREMERRARAVLARLNLDLDVHRLLGDHSIAIQQMVAIGRALQFDSKVLILDEPTSSLDAEEVQQLFAVMRKLRDEGHAIIFVTHFLDQVYAVADRITVLRNGELVGEYETARLPKVELVSRLLGKALHELATVRKGKEELAARSAGEPVLRVRHLGKAGVLEPFDLDIHAGEVLGLAGLLGSGRTEMASLVFGIEKADQGEVAVKGRRVNLTSPVKALQAGIGLCPEDRKGEGIVEDLSVRENIVLALQVKQGWWQNLSRARQEELAERYVKLLDIRTPSADQAIKNLSGGNQQKAVVARWLAAEPSLLILDEPTRGIDVGAKAEIQKLIVELGEKGIGVLFISSELDEVLRCADRVAVLRDRAKVGELAADQLDEQSVMRTIAQTGAAAEGAAR
jgi:galactofuranose transport system ATP-binding protein